MTYLLQASSIWIVLFAIYFFGLRGLTFFNHNRLYLLCSLLLGLIVPAIAPLIEISKPQPISFAYTYQSIEIENLVTETVYNWSDYLFFTAMFLYWIGVIFMAIRLVAGLHSIYRMYQQGEKVMKNNLEFIYNDKAHLPFSFLNKIFLSKSITFNEDINQVIHHEITHVKQKHTVDVLFIELTHVFFWFNPIIIFYKKAMKDAHEYIADNAVVSDQDKTSYISLLFNATASDLELGLVNSFFNSQLLNRIKMIDTPRSQKAHMVKYLFILPCLAGFTYLFASAKMDKNILQSVAQSDMDTIPAHQKSVHQTADVVDEVPVFKGGNEALFKYLATNISYPASARANNIEGKAVVTFTVNLDGKIEDAKIAKSVNPEIDQEALRVVNEMNTKTEGWMPAKLNASAVKTSFSLPIQFKLDGEKNSVKEESKTITKNEDTQPLIIVDDEEQTADVKIDDLDPNDIESVNILKGESAVVKYGDKGKNGVILVKTKNSSVQSKKKNLDELVVVGMPAKNSSPVADVVSERPTFPGGDQALFTYLGENIKYPEAARTGKVEGRVIVKFIVRKDGSITDVNIIRGIGSGCDEEATRVIYAMPNWSPGKNKGEAVDVNYTIPIQFKLDSKSIDSKAKENKINVEINNTNAIKGIVIRETPSTSGKLIFNYNTNDLSNEVHINVVDVSGKIIAKSNIKTIKSSNTIELPISNQHKGLLIINVNQGASTTNAKVVGHN